MLKATLESSSLTLDLDEISANGEGAQALAGMTGLGLPPVDVQWSEGAGDGATHRSTRVLPRDVDIPIYIVAEDRDALRTKLRTFAQVVAGKITAKLWDSETTYVWADFHRVGGGTYDLGGNGENSTTGEYEFRSILTLRAGNPFWLHADTATDTTIGTNPQTRTLNNAGTVDAVPTFRLTGPAAGVDLVGPNGDRFSWGGNLATGSAVTIDPTTGTVFDQAGNNRYGGLSYAPKFWRIPPGDASVGVTITPRTPGVRKNYETNPAFGANSTAPWVASPSGSNVVASAGRLFVGPSPSGGVLNGYGTSSTRHGANRTLTGLPAGADFVFRARMQLVGGATLGTGGLTLNAGTSVSPVAANQDGSVVEVAINFTVPDNGSITYRVAPPYTNQSSTVYRVGRIALDQVYVGPAGSYFDGSFPAGNGETYAWDGTANNSTSTATEVTGGTPTLTIEWRPRDWMVV